jgi:sugar lactone lactonase YvrE
MCIWNRCLNLATLACCLSLSIPISNTPAAAWNRGAVQTFAVLPAGVPMVEGLTVGPDGNVYAATFNPTGGPSAQLLTFDPQGHLLKQVTIQGASSAMLGLGFAPGTDQPLVIDFGRGVVMKVDPNSGQSVDCLTAPGGGNAGLNAMAFDAAGNIYVSASFQGIIYKNSSRNSICPSGLAPPSGLTPWFSSMDLLGPSNGIPPFGANGLGFNKAGTAMFVANTAMDWIVKIDVSGGPGGQAGNAAVFTTGINGADGLILDSNDNLWVAANQADEIVVVDPTGKAIAKLGDFDGVRNGVTNGLLFPASPAFSKDGQWLYVTNLELDLTTIPTGPNTFLPQSVDSQWTREVKRHSIAKLGARIPPIQGQ